MGTLFRRTPQSYWYAEFRDSQGRRVKRSTRTKSKTTATKILAKWEREAHAIEHGVGSLNLTLVELVNEYGEYLSGDDPQHISYTKYCLTRIFSANSWTDAQQITQYQVETVVRKFTKPDGKTVIGARTQAHYLGAAKSFTKWLRVIRKVIQNDPLEAIKKPNPEKGRVFRRRFLLPDEWPWLAKTEHALLYETAIQTGLRANELLHVRPAHLRTNHIELPGKHTKNGELAKQYLTKDLAKRLKGKLPFRVPADDRLAELLRGDLKVALELAVKAKHKHESDFLQPRDARGDVLDFHALRHTCGAWLAISGVQPKVIQTVMRHSSITLTLDTYGHLLPGAEEDAIQHFEKLMQSGSGFGTS